MAFHPVSGQQTLSDHLSKPHHRKTHFFDYKNGLPIVSGKAAENTSRGTNGKLNATSTSFGANTTLGISMKTSAGVTVPAFVALDGKVLRFDAYFYDNVEDTSSEEFRIRKCIVYYYLVDDSIRVAEPRVENSGISQGSFLKRHKVPNGEGGFVHWSSLNVGSSFRLYGRDFNITDCDQFTRDFLAQQGNPQPEGEAVPQDPYIVHRESIHPGQRKGKVDVQDRRWRFQQFNRKVLRFYCAWDDRDSMHGERRLFIMHYYMEDQTGEILEDKSATVGREGYGRLLKRQKLPKQYGGLSDMPANSGNILTDADLRVGGTINVFGREFLLYDCDESTKEYLREVYGVKEFPNLKHLIQDTKTPLPKMPPPPYTGYGTPEDSLGSFYNLVPKAPRRNFGKQHLDGKMLRWMAKFKAGTSTPEEEERRFVITLYLADDTISIFEPPVKNSGMLSGKFLERSTIYKKNPRGQPEEKYVAEDFALGNVIEVHSHVFELVDCDEYTKKYMTTGKAKPIAAAHLDDLHHQVRNVLSKKKALVTQKLRERDIGNGVVGGDDLISVLKEFIDVDDEITGPFLKFWGISEVGTVNYLEFLELMS